MAHTPGPWFFTDAAVYTPVAGGICEKPSHDYSPDNWTANAQLIASAPELLDALYTALPFVEDALEDAGYKKGVVAAVIRQIRTAIDHAEGS